MKKAMAVLFTWIVVGAMMAGGVRAHGSHGGGFSDRMGPPSTEPPHTDESSGDDGGGTSWWPFGRKPSETPESVSAEEEKLDARLRIARATGRPTKEVKMLENELSEVMLRLEIARKRKERDAHRMSGDSEEAGKLEREIHALKARLCAKRGR